MSEKPISASTPQLRKRKTKLPCQVCFLHQERCICEFIPQIEVKTKLSLIVHAKELKRTTNTGRLAVHALKNSQLYTRGLKDSPLTLPTLISGDYQNYLLYPADDAIDAVELAKLNSKKPVHLIVPDGNWRQASKVGQRHPELNLIPRVKINTLFFQKKETDLHLRKEHFPNGMATLEAIAHVYAFIEGADCGQKLMDLYLKKLQATLAGRAK